MGEGAPTVSRGRSLVRIGVVFALLGSAAVAIFQAQKAGEEALLKAAGPYFDAIVAGDFGRATALDHTARELDDHQLEAAYSARKASFGSPTGWSIVVANAARDADGELLLGTIHLQHDGRSDPVAVRAELRDDGGALKIVAVRAISTLLRDEVTW